MVRKRFSSCGTPAVPRSVLAGAAVGTASLIAPGAALADVAGDALFTANNVWMMLSAALVFTMHLGFAMVESGLTRAKNTTNILFKNTFIICCGILTYFLVGFNLMYPGDFGMIDGVLGFAGMGLGAGFAEGANTPEYADESLLRPEMLSRPVGPQSFPPWSRCCHQAVWASWACCIPRQRGQRSLRRASGQGG